MADVKSTSRLSACTRALLSRLSLSLSRYVTGDNATQTERCEAYEIYEDSTMSLYFVTQSETALRHIIVRNIPS